MPYVGGKLTSFFGRGPQAATRRTARGMARKGGRRMTEITKLNTPVETGHLRKSFRTKTVKEIGDAYESGVETFVSYAPYVEYGTGLWGPSHAKYVIKPHSPGGMLHWVDPKTGEDVFARMVLHPGSPGNHMVAIAADVVHNEVRGSLFRIDLAVWANACARSANRETPV